ncbi:hypothetical protein SETIT_7G034300v2 [Setaria italica]|uniref:Uncharacterized protein n=2 Tax=Setaria TaxID=4554 RepID=A0A368RRW7_SETIT|nr:hypothetical protein SETIT_7G034300v2 [Setaria italica]TKW03407.1 hypothetical protein SEVIR_7G021300v2 [Setaria viridis]
MVSPSNLDRVISCRMSRSASGSANPSAVATSNSRNRSSPSQRRLCSWAAAAVARLPQSGIYYRQQQLFSGTEPRN